MSLLFFFANWRFHSSSYIKIFEEYCPNPRVAIQRHCNGMERRGVVESLACQTWLLASSCSSEARATVCIMQVLYLWRAENLLKGTWSYFYSLQRIAASSLHNCYSSYTKIVSGDNWTKNKPLVPSGVVVLVGLSSAFVSANTPNEIWKSNTY